MIKKVVFSSVLLLAVLLCLVGCNKFEAPKNLRVEEGSILFWDSNENASSFKLRVTDDEGSNFNFDVEKGINLDILDLELGAYTLKLKAIYPNGESDFSDAISYSQGVKELSVPSDLKIEAGRISWKKNANAKSFVVKFEKEGFEKEQALANGADLSTLDLTSGVYNVSVKAIGNTTEYKDSKYSEPVLYDRSLVVLDAPVDVVINNGYLNFSGSYGSESFVILLTNDGGASEEIEVDASGILLNALDIEDGLYSIKVKSIGDKIKYDDSEYSEAISYQHTKTYMVLKEEQLIDNKYVKWMGRTYYNEETKVNEIYHSASGFEVYFNGPEVTALITATKYTDKTKQPYIVIVLDDNWDEDAITTIVLTKKETLVTLATGINDGLEHKVTVYKRSESIDSHIGLKELSVVGMFSEKIVNKARKIEVIAASSSTGYGNLSSTGQSTANADCLRAFAFLSARALNADISIYSASGWGCRASQWTNPQTLNMYDAYKKVDMFSDVNWTPSKFIPDVVVMNLGTNDWSYIKQFAGSQKDEKVNEFVNQYVDFIKYVHSLYPEAQIIMVYGIMNETDIYQTTKDIYNIAKVAVPNLSILEVHGDGKGYNSHPSVTSHAIIAATLTNHINKLMGWNE